MSFRKPLVICKKVDMWLRKIETSSVNEANIHSTTRATSGDYLQTSRKLITTTENM